MASWKKITAARKIQTKGNGKIDHLATDQEKKEAKRFAASLTVAENRLSKECNRYQKCTARLRKAEKN